MKGNVITRLYFSTFPCSHTKNYIMIILTVTMRSTLKNMKLIIRMDSAIVALRNNWTAYVKYFVLNVFLLTVNQFEL